MTLFFGVFGYMMEMHQTRGDLRETMHEMVGYFSMGTAIARMGCIFWNKMTVIYGYLCFSVGMFLSFANPKFTRYWEHSVGYSNMAYVMIVLLLSLYVPSIAKRAKQFIQEKQYEKVATSDVDENKLLMDTDVAGLDIVMS